MQRRAEPTARVPPSYLNYRQNLDGLALEKPRCVQIVRTSGLPLYETMARRSIIARRRVVAVQNPQLIAVSLRVFRYAYRQHP